MKKTLRMLLLPGAMFLLAGNLTSCSLSEKEIAMISDVGDIDDGSFNQGCWEAVKAYAHENNRTYDYYRPFADSDFARECAVKQAVTKGAKIVILPGFKFADGAIKIAKSYENKGIHFVLIDSGLEGEVPSNLICVTYNFQHSGWLAGYTVARDYFLTDWANEGKLRDHYGFGFYGGMANQGVYPYGFGYIQGILYAAEEFTQQNNIAEADKPNIGIKYSYSGVFMQDDLACSTVKGWLTNKDNLTQCVFSCGGKLYQSVTEAVKFYNEHNLPESVRNFEDQHAPRDAARWIGVDGDQYSLVQDYEEKKSIYTSALKDVGETCKTALAYHFDNNWNALSESFKKIESDYKSFNLGLESSFISGSTKEYDKQKDYVGIVEAKKDGSNVLRGFNHVKLTDLKEKIELLKEEKITVYKGTTKEFSETEGYPTFFNDKSWFDDETYNLYAQVDESGSKYPLSKYKVEVI